LEEGRDRIEGYKKELTFVVVLAPFPFFYSQSFDLAYCNLREPRTQNEEIILPPSSPSSNPKRPPLRKHFHSADRPRKHTIFQVALQSQSTRGSRFRWHADGWVSGKRERKKNLNSSWVPFFDSLQQSGLCHGTYCCVLTSHCCGFVCNPLVYRSLGRFVVCGRKEVESCAFVVGGLW
jgi:hypothetical protein